MRVLCLLGLAVAAHGEVVWLDDLNLSPLRQGWGTVQLRRAIRESPLTLAGQTHDRGIGTHARSILWLELDGGPARFAATVGVDDAAGGPGSVRFRVFADERSRFDSGVLRWRDPPQNVALDLNGVRSLLLLVDDAGDGINFDHANWADARFEVAGAPPRPVAAPPEPAEILSPPPGPAPHLNGPLVHGCRPGRPFLYRLPCTGARPLRFAADGLPDGLALDSRTGIITGRVARRGTWRVTLRAHNDHGRDARRFDIVVGDTLALTPPMGWNHWYAHYGRITDAMVRDAAERLIASGMADAGYDYVCLDDCWMNAPRHGDPKRAGPLRDALGRVMPNAHFPDMAALCRDLHALGLKAGLYISPGPLTCAGFAGSLGHEAQDAATFADWGFDLLKYDWCSYGGEGRDDGSPAARQAPYRLMGRLLAEQPRDIVLNLCQYGMSDVWTWGRDVGGQSWRTGGDLGFELDRVFEVALRNVAIGRYNGPGGWNDPDYLQIGWVGDAHRGGEPAPSRLTPNEQHAFMSLWSLLAAPLFYSGDMTRLDPFTLSILCNPEVIAVNQDPLGRCATLVAETPDTFVLAKPLEDGSLAVGLANRGEFAVDVSVALADLGRRGPQQVRDLWRRRDDGIETTRLHRRVGRHFVELFKLTAAPQRRRL